MVQAEKPRVWTVWLAIVVSLLAAVLSIAIAGVAALGLELARGKSLVDAQAGALATAQTPLFLALTSAFGSTLLGLVALAAARFSKAPLRERLRLGPSEVGPLATAGWVVALVALSIGLDAIVGLFRPVPSDVARNTARIFHDAPPLPFALLVLSVGVLAPLVEELLFRGYVQSRLVARWGRAWGIGITAVVFGAYHADLVHGLCAAALGVVLGLLAERARSIRPGTIAHLVNNTLALVIAKLSSLDEIPTAKAHAVTLAIATVVFAGGIVVARRASSPTQA